MDIRTLLTPLPATIGGFTIFDSDGYYTIVLNSILSHEKNKQTYLHEYYHIMKGDFERRCSADMIEMFSHKNLQND